VTDKALGGGGDVDYDVHGQGYARQRRTDPRIAAQVTQALGDARTILNVGAGAGSYEPLDRHVIAIEPSTTMRAQRPAHLAPAIVGFAESIPLDNQSVDASMAMVTAHQWSDLGAGIRELVRVTRGPIVLLTFDGDAMRSFWLSVYAQELMDVECPRYPKIDRLSQLLGGTVSVGPVQIPFDCTDGFTEAFYGRPEKLLEPGVRRSQSSWTFLAEGVEFQIVERLDADLQSGDWDERFGHWRNEPFYEGSLRLIVSTGR